MKFSKHETNFNLGKEITLQELNTTLEKFSPYKSAGENSIQAIIFKNLPADYMETFRQLLNIQLYKKVFTQTNGIINLLHKSGDINNIGNYRLITYSMLTQRY
jgi:hypothetical protein